jgi:hypothetical protein
MMPLRALKTGLFWLQRTPFFAHSGKIFNQINPLWTYTSYAVES